MNSIYTDEDNDDSSNIITDTHKLEKHRPKLLQFCENRRPPYWGTWRKRSSILKSRRPFAKDEVRIIILIGIRVFLRTLIDSKYYFKTLITH